MSKKNTLAFNPEGLISLTAQPTINTDEIPLSQLLYVLRDCQDAFGNYPYKEIMKGIDSMVLKDAEKVKALKALTPFRLMKICGERRVAEFDQITPFNLTAMLTEQRIQYTLKNIETKLTAMKGNKEVVRKDTTPKLVITVNGEEYYFKRMGILPIFDPSQAYAVNGTGTWKFPATKRISDSLIYARECMLVSAVVEIVNGNFRPIGTTEQEAELLSVVNGYKPGTANLVAAFLKGAMTLNEGLQLRGEKLAHYMMISIGHLNKAQRIVVAGELGSIFSDMKYIVVGEETVDGHKVKVQTSKSISVPMTQELKDVVKKHYPNSAKMDHYKKIRFYAGLQNNVNVEGVDVLKTKGNSLIYVARNFTDRSRALRGKDDKKVSGLGQLCYEETIMSDAFYKSSRAKTDFQWVERLIKDVPGIIVSGLSGDMICDFLHWLYDMDESKQIFYVTSETGAAQWYQDIEGRVWRGADPSEAVSSYFVTKDLGENDTFINEYMSKCLYLTFNPINVQGYAAKQLAQRESNLKKNEAEISKLINKRTQFKYIATYLPLVSTRVYSYTIMMTSCTPHTLLMPCLISNEVVHGGSTIGALIDRLELPKWQRLMLDYKNFTPPIKGVPMKKTDQPVFESSTYCRMSILCNRAKNAFMFTGVGPYDAMRQSKVGGQWCFEPFPEYKWKHSTMQILARYRIGSDTLTYEQLAQRIDAMDTIEEVDYINQCLNDPQVAGTVHTILYERGKANEFEKMAERGKQLRGEDDQPPEIEEKKSDEANLPFDDDGKSSEDDDDTFTYDEDNLDPENA